MIVTLRNYICSVLKKHWLLFDSKGLRYQTSFSVLLNRDIRPTPGSRGLRIPVVV